MINTLFKLAFIYNLFYLVAAIQRKEGYKSLEEETRCPDGSIGVVEHLQAYSEEPFRAAIYKVDCSAAGGWDNTTTNDASSEETPEASLSELEKRQSNLCSSSCTTGCYGGTGTPTVSDCDALANNIASRGQTHTVNGNQRLVASSGTCLFRFTNRGYGSVTWCDSYWASQSRSMQRQCLPQTPGAYCTGSGHLLDVCLNPDAPPPPTYPSQSTGTPNTDPTTAPNEYPAPGTSSSVSSSSSGAGSSTASASNGDSSSTQARATSSGTSLVPHMGPPTVDLSGNSSAGIAQSILDSDVTQKRGPNVGAIVGGVIGAVVFLAFLVVLFLWRRRRAQRRPMVELKDQDQHDAASENTYDQSTLNTRYTSAGQSNGMIATGRVIPEAPWNTKAAVVQQQQRPLGPASVYSAASSSGQGLLSHTQESTIPPDTPLAAMSLLHSDHADAVSLRSTPMDEAARRSISARTLAQTMAPELSERDILRLADTIVARMQTSGTVAVQGPPVSPTVTVLANPDDPPPPWRASWNNNGNGSQPYIA